MGSSNPSSLKSLITSLAFSTKNLLQINLYSSNDQKYSTTGLKHISTDQKYSLNLQMYSLNHQMYSLNHQMNNLNHQMYSLNHQMCSLNRQMYSSTFPSSSSIMQMRINSETNQTILLRYSLVILLLSSPIPRLKICLHKGKISFSVLRKTRTSRSFNVSN